MEDLDKWKKAGKIAAEVREYGKSLVAPGKTVLEITELLEKKIEELGAKPAFPPQLSLNEAAAHECADPDDNVVLLDQLVKVDVGVHIDGCMSDNATTVDLSGKYADLIDATQEALKLAIESMRPGTEVREIGAIIENTINLRGYEPIRNLSGHGLGRYIVHAPPSIPNHDNGDRKKLEEGMIFACEPFGTPGNGLIKEFGAPRVFMQESKKPVRDAFSRDILAHIETYKGLPFARRWLLMKFPKPKVDFALRTLVQTGNIRAYPPLVEVSKRAVAQAEHTLLVTKDGVEILTQ